MDNKYYINFGIEDFNSFLTAELDYSEGTKKVKIIGSFDQFNENKSHKEEYEYNIETLEEECQLIHYNFPKSEVCQLMAKDISMVNLGDIETLINRYFKLATLGIEEQYKANTMDMILFSVEGSETEIIVKVDYNKESHQHKDMTFSVVSYYDATAHDSVNDFDKHKKVGLEKGVLKEYKFSQADAIIPHLFRVGKDIDKLEPHDLLHLVESKYQKENLMKKLNATDNSRDRKKEGMSQLSAAFKQATKDGTVRTVVSHSDGSKSPEYCYFNSCESPFNQMHPSNYEYKNKKFTSDLQFMTYSKAMLFGDDQKAFEILDMNTSTTMLNRFMIGEMSVKDILKSKDMKTRWLNDQQKIIELGKNIKGYVEDIWLKKRVPIQTVSNREKFNQNLDMKNKLISTRDAIMIEGDKKDNIDIPNENCKILMNVREVFKNKGLNNKVKSKAPKM